jgi:hypothetical protein
MKSNVLWLYGGSTETLYENITEYSVNYEWGYVKFVDAHGNTVVHNGNFTFVEESE